MAWKMVGLILDSSHCMTGIVIFHKDIFSKCTTVPEGGSGGLVVASEEPAAAASGGGGAPYRGGIAAAPPRETRTCNSRDETRGLHHKTTYTNMSCLSTRNSKCSYVKSSVIVLIIVIVLTIANNAACVSAIPLDQVVHQFRFYGTDFYRYLHKGLPRNDVTLTLPNKADTPPPPDHFSSLFG